MALDVALDNIKLGQGVTLCIDGLTREIEVDNCGTVLKEVWLGEKGKEIDPDEQSMVGELIQFLLGLKSKYSYLLDDMDDLAVELERYA